MVRFPVVPPPSPAAGFVVAVSSNKGGVGKTTVATNLAIYLRALQEDLPILLLSLDDQGVLDRMLRLRAPGPGEGNLKHAWAERSFERVIQLGQYGLHFVPSAPDTAPLKGRAEDPRTLRRMLARTAWGGPVILDTKSDLEALTLNALQAADLAILPVSDWASLEEAGKAFQTLERARGALRARILLTLVDRRTHVGGDGGALAEHLREEARRRGWPLFRTALSRSPRVEALNSADARPLSILHEARGTQIHREMQALTEEVAREMGLELVPATRRPTPVRPAEPGLKAALLRGWLRS